MTYRMDKSKIPTKELLIGKGEDRVKVKIYKWLTQDEESEYQNIVVGSNEFEIGDNTDGVKATVPFANIAKANKFLIESMCVSIKWEEYNVWSPETREELLEKLNVIRNIKKKSSQPSSSLNTGNVEKKQTT